MRNNHSAAAPQSHKTLGKKTPESPKIPLQLGCSVTQIRHFFKRTFFNLPLIFENNVKKATVWLHERAKPTGFAKPLPLGEVSPKVTERARMLTVIQGRSDSIALTKSLLIAAWVVLSCRACPLRRFAPALPKGEPFVEEGRPCGISKASPLGRAIEKEKTAKKTLRRKKRLLPDSNRRHPD